MLTSIDAQAPPAPDAAPSPPAPDATPPPVQAPAFSEPVLVAELVADTENLNPTLTHDLQLLLFNSNGDADASVGGKDLFLAERVDGRSDFAEPSLLALSTEEFDTSPALSGDGLTIWFGTRVGQEEAKHLDIYVATRATRDEPFGEATVVAELNSEADDIPRPLGQGGLVMPFASRRDGEYQTYFASRASVGEPFSVITQAPLADIIAAGRQVEDAFLTDDGLELLFADGGDLFFAARDSLDDPFGGPLALLTINTEAREIDPWWSPDGQILYFVSDRASETPQIFRAQRLAP